ncbi:MAG: amylosucrase, partial [Anaerolineae bacterium]|nr:amylosucrase [Anaerolineae bacterium]
MLPEPHVDEISRSYRRLFPRLQARMAVQAGAAPAEWNSFVVRLERHFPDLFSLLYQVYGAQYDFFYHLEELLVALAQSWFARPVDLKGLDGQRESAPDWFASNAMLGGVLYVDLFAGDLEGVRAQIPYFKELGLTYLHLMPLFKVPEPENDGGYAISSYREVNPAVGSMAQLSGLARELRDNGISLVLDFV